MAEQEKKGKGKESKPAVKAQPDDQSPRRNEGQEQSQDWFVEDEHGNRAQKTPDEDVLPDHMMGWPEGNRYAGLTVAKLQNPVQEQERQRAEAYPMLPQHYFDPEAHAEEYSDLYVSMAGTCFVTVNEEVVYDGRAILSGYQELPKNIAQYLVDNKLAYEPAGQKPS